MVITKGNPKRLEKNLSERHLDYHKRHVKCPGIDSSLLLLEAST